MNSIQPALNLETVDIVRRNHALEHATLNILNKHFPQISLSGYSHPGGFWILGEIATSDLETAAFEALRRLKEGEAQLAIHPHCGTNDAVMGMAAGTAACLAMLGTPNNRRKQFDRFPLAISFATIALIAARPLGPELQKKVTTNADPGDLVIFSVEDITFSTHRLHLVHTGVIQG